MKSKLKCLLGVICAAVFVLALLGACAAPPTQQEPGSAADFTLYDREGSPVQFTSGGEPMVLNFWASWCPACTRMMPALQAAYEQFGEEASFIAVNLVGGRETHERALAATEGNGFTFPVLFDPHRDTFGAFGATHLPTTVFIDSDGAEIHRQVGTMTESTLIEQIERIR